MKREIISYRFPNELIANYNWKSILLNRYGSIFCRFYPKTIFLKQKTRIIFFFSYNYHLILLNNFTLNICSQFVSCFTKCKFFFLHELKKLFLSLFRRRIHMKAYGLKWKVNCILNNIYWNSLIILNLCTHLTRVYIENCLFLSRQSMIF